MSDDVLAMCTCEHPRHGHANERKMIGRRRFGGREHNVRTYCTMKMPDGSLCECLHFEELAPVPAVHGNGWRSITVAPRNATWLEVWNGGIVAVAHWAEDLSGEDQPPFRGWFVRTLSGQSFDELRPAPTHWRPLPPGHELAR